MLLSNAVAYGSGLFPEITTNYASSCQLKEVKVTLYVTTVAGFTSPFFDTPRASLGHCGTGPTWSGCSSTSLYDFNFSVPATGNALGSSCGDFVFDTRATAPWNPDAPPPPPYSGTFQLDPARNGAGRPYHLSGLEYDLMAGGHPDDAILQCARIDITTQVVP